MKVLTPSRHDVVAPFLRSKKILPSQTPNVSPSHILSQYGPEALRACYLSLSTAHGEEVVLVPKIRKDMGEDAWESQCPKFREMVLKFFYEGL